MSTEDKVFAAFKEDPALVSTAQGVGKALGLSDNTVGQHLLNLWEKGQLVRKRSLPNEPYWYRLSLSAGGREMTGEDGKGWVIYTPPVPDEILAGREKRFSVADLPAPDPDLSARLGVVRKTYRALCVGGPLNGKWHEGNDRVFRTMEPPGPVDLMAYATEDPMVPEIKFHTYEIVRLHMFGYNLWVAFDMDDTAVLLNRDTAALRAILQRDVAQAMGL